MSISDLHTLFPTVIKIVLFVLMVVAMWVFQQYVLNPIIEKLVNYLKEKGRNVQKEILHHYNNSFRSIFFVSGLIFALSYLLSVNMWDIQNLKKLYHSFLILCLFLGIYRLFSYYAQHPDEWNLFNKEKMNSAIFPFICRFGKVAVVFLAFTVISAQWGYNMNGFVTGLGIGGFALALGAKDVLSNIFGGTAVVLDKPFSIGDVISTEDSRLQGTVEDINFRSTRIRTFDKEMIYVPNSLLANQPIYNYSRRDRRRVQFHLGLSLETPGYQVRKVMDAIKTAIIQHAGVESEDFSIFFDEYTQTSLNILVVYYTSSADYSQAMKAKEEINFIVMDILKENEIALAPAVQHMTYTRNVLK
jgi:MscS family membrane protein